jgi:hypothetical protein
MMNKSYEELVKLKTFKERYRYLKLSGRVGEETFGCDRYLNQVFYRSKEWKDFRNKIIIRDNGCDLGIEGMEIHYKLLIHHINPITKRDILERSPMLMDENNVICVSHNTHEAIHYGDESLLIEEYVPRRPNDTCPWRQ